MQARQSGSFCDDLNDLIESGAQLIDVRTWREFAGGAVDGAINLPLHTLPLRHRDLDPKRPVLLYCVSGVRSRQAAYFLSQQGFDEVYDLGGYAGIIGCRSTDR